MYRNLEAELKRKGITRKVLADTLGININTVSAKLTGRSPFLWDEVDKITTDIFHNQFDVRYLFVKTDDNDGKAAVL